MSFIAIIVIVLSRRIWRVSDEFKVVTSESDGAARDVERPLVGLLDGKRNRSDGHVCDGFYEFCLPVFQNIFLS